MGKYKAYSEYRESGVKWVGKIPSHWEVFSLKRSVEGCTNGIWGSEPTGNNDLAVIRVADFERNSNRVGLGKLTYRSVTESEYLPRALRKGDLLIEKSGGGEKTLVGCVVLFEHDFKAVTSNFVARMRPRDLFNSSFLCYCFDSLYQKRVNYPSVKQTTGIQNLDSEAYLQERFCFPSFDEQTQIAKFLDHETAKIDTLISKQERLIELLREKRQAVISHAVTKGLDGAVGMKDSGVEWLGEVPEHWKVSSLGYYAMVSTGATPDRSNPNYWEGDIPWVKTGEVKYDEIFETEEYITPQGVVGSAVTVSPPGTLLMAMYGQGVTRGRVALLGIYAAYNQACAAITPNTEIRNQYLYYFFMAAYHAIRDGGNETSQMNLSSGLVGKFKITIPTLAEQYEIVGFLDTELKKINLLIDKAVRGIKLMRERRAALISAAVTGRIDVRDVELS